MNEPEISLKISLKIPPKYHDTPIIFQLVSQYNLQVNITSALLGELVEEEGWFNLLLKGTKSSINEGLQYLADSHIEVWESDRQEPIPLKEWQLEDWEMND